MRTNKGELTTKHIVLLIIVIVSFAVILFFLLRLDLGKETEKELCHNSVVMRGTSFVPSDTLPLKCKTNYVCISKDGSCEKMTTPEIKKAKTRDEVYKILADDFVDCWWMFGEGKINYVSDTFFSEVYCSICSQIAFDDSVEEIFNQNNFSEKELYDYMGNENMPKRQTTYVEYLYEGVKDFSKIHSGPFKEINFDKQYYVVMGITSDINMVGWVFVGAGVLATATAVAIWAPVTIPILGAISVKAVTGVSLVGGAALSGGIGGHFVGTVVKGLSGNDFLRPTILEANAEEFNSLKCHSINTLN